MAEHPLELPRLSDNAHALHYLELVREINPILGLTSDIYEFGARHMREAALLARLIKEREVTLPLIDLGAGSGVLGVMVALVTGRPVEFWERSERKCAFLDRVIHELGLSGSGVVMVDLRRHPPLGRPVALMSKGVMRPRKLERFTARLLSPAGGELWGFIALPPEQWTPDIIGARARRLELFPFRTKGGAIQTIYRALYGNA